MTTETSQSVIERCAKIEREMTALTKELRQKTAELKALFEMYHQKYEKLNDEWDELFATLSDNDAARKAYWDLTEDIQRDFS